MQSNGFAGPVTLEGRVVRLVPLDPGHAGPLAEAARDPEVSRYLRSPLPAHPVQMAEVIAHRLDLAQRGQLLPFVTTLVGSGRVVGTTNFMRPDLANQSVEIGGTWIDSAYWRTAVNTEAKFLMLEFAFESAKVHRVYLQTDARNDRSRQAILRLGAVAEATFREDAHLGDGFYRTSVYFGILAPEWPAVRERLRGMLARAAPLPPDRPRPGHPLPPVSPREFRVEPPAANPRALRSAPTLVGRYVRLVPLTREHIPALAHAGRDPEVWRYLRFKPGTSTAGITNLVDTLLREQGEGTVQPMVVVLNEGERVLGIARYLDIDRQNSQVEIGTWIDSEFWRTPVNTELKYLVLRHAFETERLHRVALRTDSRNARSQAAIERLGAVKEGLLREHNLRPGPYWRSSYCYSILAVEWPAVAAELLRKLARPWDRGASPRPSAGTTPP